MKKTMILAGLVATASLNAAVIDQVIVRQQWPWSTDVKVEYRVTGVTTPVDVAVRAFNGETELDASNLETAITGERFGISADGAFSFTINPAQAFGTERVLLTNFKVKLSLTPAATNINEVIYKVFDLSTGACQDITRADFYNAKVESGEFVTNFTAVGSGFGTTLGDVFIWTGVTNNVKYKTTHLVMRKIPAASYGVWTMGSPESETMYQGSPAYRDKETNHFVRLTHDYYIGVFEVTQKQFFLLTGKNTASTSDQERDDADVLAITKLDYGGYGNYDTACGFIGKLRQKTGNSNFDLPTDARWEFACRAGTQTALNNGHNVTPTALWSNSDAWANKVAWYGPNSEIDGTRKVHPVGQLAPNAFGLYDMHGNVWEWCLDFYSEGANYIASFGAGWTPETVVVDPTGPASAVSSPTKRVVRSGSCEANSYGVVVRSAYRTSGTPWTTPNNYYGMRVALSIAE